jgi:hypothetical protein
MSSWKSWRKLSRGLFPFWVIYLAITTRESRFLVQGSAFNNNRSRKVSVDLETQ